MKRRITTVTIILVAGLLIVLAVVRLNGRQGTEPEGGSERTEVAVSVTRPTIDSLFQEVRYLGTIEGEQDALLGFRIGGSIAKVYVQEGQRVVQGQKLAELDQPEAAARIERARTELARSEANQQHWKRELDIDERLLQAGAVSRSKRDQAQLAYTNALRAADAAAASLNETVSLASAAELLAPQDGTIGRIDRTVGESAMPGQPILLMNAGRLLVRTDVLDSDLARGIDEGSRVLLSTRACQDVPGRVKAVETSVREPFKSVRVYLDFPEQCLASLPSGATVSVTFLLQQEANAILLPASAIDQRGGESRVFRVGKNQTVEAVPVEIGLLKGDWQQVIGPIAPTDLIVVSGTTNIESGMVVLISDEWSTRELLGGDAQ